MDCGGAPEENVVRHEHHRIRDHVLFLRTARRFCFRRWMAVKQQRKAVKAPELMRSWVEVDGECARTTVTEPICSVAHSPGLPLQGRR